jgi:hypothetical protein
MTDLGTEYGKDSFGDFLSECSFFNTPHGASTSDITKAPEHVSGAFLYNLMNLGLG